MKKNELSNYFTNSNTRTTLFSIEFWSLVLVHSVILFPPLSTIGWNKSAICRTALIIKRDASSKTGVISRRILDSRRQRTFSKFLIHRDLKSSIRINSVKHFSTDSIIDRAQHSSHEIAKLREPSLIQRGIC